MTTVCIVCGQEIKQKGGRGRVRIYHPDCKKLMELISWMDSLNIDFKNEHHRRRIRANLFYIANTIGGSK